MTMIDTNIQKIHARISQACAKVGRDPQSVRLLAVSKTVSAEAVWAAHVAGQHAFGENYVQEGVEKIQSIRHRHPMTTLEWHHIGPLQTNKTRLVAEHFDWVQSIDRLVVAQRLSQQRPPHLPPLQVCLQVNVDNGPNKSGVAPTALLALAQAVSHLPNVRLRGLMCIPEPTHDQRMAVAVFQSVQTLLHELNGCGAAPSPLDTLSMGMSDDLEAAIAGGATMVRIGRAVFGERPPQKPIGMTPISPYSSALLVCRH